MRRALNLVLGFVMSVILATPAFAGDYDHCEQILRQGIHDEISQKLSKSAQSYTTEQMCNEIKRSQDNSVGVNAQTDVFLLFDADVEVSVEYAESYYNRYCSSSTSWFKSDKMESTMERKVNSDVVDAWETCISTRQDGGVEYGFVVQGKNDSTIIVTAESFTRGQPMLSGKLTVAMNEGGDPNTDIDCFGELLSPLSKKDKQYLKRTGYIRMQRGREYQAQCNRRPVSLTNDQGVGYQAFPEVILTLTTLDSSWSYTFPEEPMGPYPTERDTILKYFTDGDFVPVGAVVAFAGSYDSVPEGWELCDGEELLRNNYSELFDIIGTQYGAPSDELYFRLPDYRGVFLRASDQTDRGNAGRDSSFEERGTGHDGWEDRVGSYSTDELESHDHYVSLRLPHILRENHSGHYLQDVSLGGSGAAGYFDPEKHEVARAEKGGSSEETYPKNTLIHYIIKVANFME